MRLMASRTRLWFKIAVALTFVFCLFVLSVSTEAAPPSQPPRPQRPVEAPLQELPRLNPEATEPSSQTHDWASLDTADGAEWSSIVFQSLRDGNWEVYTATGDGLFQTRLTDNPASDIYPSHNRGCTRVAFASLRTGNYDIYLRETMGYVRQLTLSGADDVKPTWSPDGTRIAFQSYRDGQAEVYVMDANGGNQTRLTFDSAYDGDPAWSPDGTRIAFVSGRTSGYQIWVMNSDGSNQVQLSNQAYSENPAWSPDGTKIAYDADGNGDGWQELWLMDAEGMNQREVYNPSEPQTDAWAGSWSPDGQFVAFTRISFVVYGGNWYWTVALLDKYDVSTGRVSRLSEQGTDWNPDWQVCDLQPPESQVFPLPSYSRNAFTIHWGGQDVGLAGIASYDVQYRDQDTGEWIALQTETVETTTDFLGTPGHTYDFRSRARDVAGNVEDWPSGDGDAHTVPYTWAITGTVRDNTGIPVTGVTVTTVPTSFSSMTSTSTYTAYVGGLYDVYTATWTKDAYSALPATGFDGIEDDHFDVVLSPGDNLVSNWGFENGSLGSWVASGAISPSITSAGSHTGDHAAMLGTTSFAHTVGTSESPQMAIDDASTLHVVWVDNTSGTNEIYYVNRSKDGQWGWPQSIPNGSRYSINPRMAVSAGGVIHVVWGERTPGEGALYHARRDGDGPWTSPEVVIDSPNLSDKVDQYQVVMDGEIVHMVWHQEQDIYYAQWDITGKWSSPQLISVHGEFNWQSETPDIVIDENGVVHVVWVETIGEDCYVYYAYRSIDGAWSTPEPRSQSMIFIGASPKLTLDPDGATLHLAWINTGPSKSKGLYYAQRSTDGIWSASEKLGDSLGWYTLHRLLTGPDGTIHMLYSYSISGYGYLYHSERVSPGVWTTPQDISDGSPGGAQVVVEDSGVIHVVWERNCYPEPSEIYYVWRTVSGTWTAPENLSNTSGKSISPRLGVDAEGTLCVVWVDDTFGSQDIMYHIDPNPIVLPVGESSLSQSVTIPVTMTMPTLSFFYQLTNEWETNDNPLSIWVDDGLSVTTVFSTTEPTGSWTHRSINLSRWRGQTITLTLNQHNIYSMPCSWALLDEVTIGSGYPDLWIDTGISPDQVPPGEQIIQTITYGNQGGGVTKQTLIAVTWPSELILVDADPWPSAVSASLLAWDLGEIAAKSGPCSVTITATVAATATMWQPLTTTVDIDTLSPEIEMTNNAALDSVLVLGPDLWVSKAAQSGAAMPGEEVIYTIAYGNNGEAGTSGVLITDPLSPEAIYVDASPLPVSGPPTLEWEVTLPGQSGSSYIVVTTTVASTATFGSTITNTVSITSPAPELDTSNNVGETVVFVGNRAYLPVIMANWYD